MDKKYIAIIVILVIIVLGIIIAFTYRSLNATGNVTKTIDRPVKEFTMQSFTEVIDGKYYPQYSFKEISVNQGDLVRIKITNTKGTHDFKIDEFNVYSMTPLNEEVTIEFVADKKGSFEYYCTQPGHRQNGHWGTLKVL
jgi:heme/copper-type cytochrome/quinol oxidase subunit 2